MSYTFRNNWRKSKVMMTPLELVRNFLIKHFSVRKCWSIFRQGQNESETPEHSIAQWLLGIHALLLLCLIQSRNFRVSCIPCERHNDRAMGYSEVSLSLSHFTFLTKYESASQLDHCLWCVPVPFPPFSSLTKKNSKGLGLVLIQIENKWWNLNYFAKWNSYFPARPK